MNVKKNMFWMVFGTLMVLATGTMLFMLWKTSSGYAGVIKKLREAESEYSMLSNGRPYPSDENVKIVNENFEKIEVFFDELKEDLCRDQIEAEVVTRAQFSERLEVMFAGLQREAENANVQLPEDFHFGFEIYKEGDLPEQESVPRLMMQLKSIESVCRMLFSNKVVNVSAIEREVFESPVGGDGFGSDGRLRRSGASRLAGEAGSEPAEQRGTELYLIEELTISFTAKDEQLWGVLNALSAERPFAVVKSLQLFNAKDGEAGRGRAGRSGMEAFRPPARFSPGGRETSRAGAEYESRSPWAEDPFRRRGAGRGTDAGAMLTREDRTVAGLDETVEVHLTMDLYRFCVEEDEDENRAEEPAEREAES